MGSSFKQLIAIESLVTVAGSLAGVFSIVYLVNLSFTLLEASLFYVVAFVATVLLCLVVTRTGFKRPRRWMSAAMLSLSLFYLSFNFLDGYWLLFFTPLLFAPYVVGFWVPFNVLILNLTSKKNRGETLGLFFLVFPAIGVVGPLLAGFLITNVGYWPVFGCAFLALLANALLILMCPVTIHAPMKPRITFRGMGNRLSLAFFLEGGQEGIWFTASPLLALLFAEDEMMLGILFSLFALAGGISVVIAGRISDRKGDRIRYARFGAIIIVPFIVLASLAPDLYVYAISMAVANMFIIFIPVFLFALASDRMEKAKPDLTLSRELLLNAGRVMGAVVCTVLILLTNDIRLAFMVSAVMVAGIIAVK